MTKEKFDKAKDLNARIDSICELLEILEGCCIGHATTATSAYLGRSGSSVHLTTSEVTCIREALSQERNRLLEEFSAL